MTPTELAEKLVEVLADAGTPVEVDYQALALVQLVIQSSYARAGAEAAAYARARAEAAAKEGN